MTTDDVQGFAEAFMDGSVDIEDLSEVLEVSFAQSGYHFLMLTMLQLFITNRDASSDYSTVSSVALSVLSGLYRASNTLSISLSNVSAHYDISNKIFASFLSDDMTYSCPLWSSACLQTSNMSGSALLEKAQRLKLRRIISDARIKASDHVLEIGTGWGSFAIEAVRSTGCTVTSVTLSIEQKEEAENRITAAGLSDKINVMLMDYRKIAGEGVFDKVVSIEMIEHVGRENLATYFKCIDKLLNKKHGIAVFQTSTMPDNVSATSLTGSLG
jgi:cyclopropane-fatty-acyl-phospholipid synthase